jgi:THO complex subunit 3
VEVNEISWNTSGDLFYLTTGQGTIKIFDYPSFKLLHTLRAHTANCYCIEIDPRGRYLAAGSADATVSLWDLDSYTCLRSFTELRYVIRGQFWGSCAEFADLLLEQVAGSHHKLQL